MAVGLLLIGSAAATAALVAAAARLSSLVSTLLVAYLAYVGNIGLVTLALSPLREVTRGGLAVAEAVLLLAAVSGWWLRGRPGLGLARGAPAVLEVVRDPVTALFAAVVAALLAYEFVLGLVPPNNGDVLAYHLARAAAWAQHGGIYWIANAPDVRMNAFQSLAEQQLLFVLVATGKGALLSALPQQLAELAILLAVYGSARRLGFEVRAAACSAFLLATFSLVALQAVTAKNDLVAASFPAVAACLLLGSGGVLEPALAGVAAGMGLGVKASTVVVLPVLVWLAAIRGRKVLLIALAGAAAGFVAIGMWSYVLNLVHDGSLLGTGTAGPDSRGSPSWPGSVATAFYVAYGLMDMSVISDHLVYALAVAGLAAAIGVWAWSRRAGPRPALERAAGVATPFLAPILVLGGAGLLALLAGWFGFPIRGPNGILAPLDADLNEVYTRFANEDFSAFGPIGIVAIVAAIALAVVACVRRRADARYLALATAVPLFLLFEALEASWGPALIHYFLVPVALAAPLLGFLLRGRVTRAAYLGVAALTVGLTLTHDQPKPLAGAFGRPWDLNEVSALYTNSDAYIADALTAYDTLVPPDACVGTVVNAGQDSYLLFGPHLQHHVFFLPATSPVDPALADGVFYVVIGAWSYGWVATEFENAGWSVSPLGTYWLLASEPRYRGAGTCRA